MAYFNWAGILENYLRIVFTRMAVEAKYVTRVLETIRSLDTSQSAMRMWVPSPIVLRDRLATSCA